jgi:hypothetical protein
MSKSTFKKTATDNLVSNLRGEIGEIIASWILMRDYMIISNRLSSHEIEEDIDNQELVRIHITIDVFKNDIISRLSELSERTFGQVNFHFASQKLKILQSEVLEFQKFIKNSNFKDRRNEYISHKKLPPNWEDHQAPHRITYKTLLRGIAFSLILMKEIDRTILGLKAKKQWNLLREKRYNLTSPPSIAYILLPYYRK